MLDTNRKRMTEATHTNSKADIGAKLIAKAERLIPTLRQRVLETERRCIIPEHTMADFQDSGILRVIQPTRFGGYELDLDILTEIAIILAKGCGSSGWVYSVFASHHWNVAIYPEETQHEVWGSNPNALIASSLSPAGRATRVDDGFMLDGHWKYSSGCEYADWFLLAAVVPSSHSSVPDIRYFLIPKRDCSIIRGWYSMGLRGTGSHDVKVQGVFIPGHRAMTFSEITSGDRPGRRINTAPLYSLPYWSTLPIALAACAVGIAQGGLDAYIEMAKTSNRSILNKKRADLETTQALAAESSGEIEAARLLILNSGRESMRTANSGQALTVEQRLRNRRDHAFTVQLAIRAIERLFKSSGARALDLDNTLQRTFRDVHAVSAHIAMAWDIASKQYGEFLLGKKPSTSLF